MSANTTAHVWKVWNFTHIFIFAFIFSKMSSSLWGYGIGRTKKAYAPRKVMQRRRQSGRFKLGYGPGYSRTGGFWRANKQQTRGKQELKFKDQLLTDQAVLVAGLVMEDTIHVIDTGVGPEQRIGRKSVIRSVQMHLQFYLPEAVIGSSGVGSDDTVRFMVVLDRQCNGTAPSVGTIFETSLVTTILSPLNLENKHRYKVLKTMYCKIEPKVLALTSASADSSIVPFTSKFINVYIPFKRGIIIEYSGATGSIGEMRSNNIFIVAFSQHGDARVTGTIRVRFTDA